MKIYTLLVALVVAAGPAAAAPGGPSDDVQVREDFVRVAPAQGPAWWKVSKGDSVVWIMGLPPGRAEAIPAWDKAAFRRRLAHARMYIAPFGNEPAALTATSGLTCRQCSQPMRGDF